MKIRVTVAMEGLEPKDGQNAPFSISAEGSTEIDKRTTQDLFEHLLMSLTQCVGQRARNDFFARSPR